MKKLNTAWVFSDGIKGHEVQSMALANAIAKQVIKHQCKLKKPWLFFAPRRFPFFSKGIHWQSQKPMDSSNPDCIISCGRRMAAVAKEYSQRCSCPHIQILNPGDSFKNYWKVILPQHDEQTGENLITIKGSLHSYNSSSLEEIKSKQDFKKKEDQKLISIFVGEQSKSEIVEQLIEHNKLNFFHNNKVFLVLSRRSIINEWKKIQTELDFITDVWLNEQSGENPYSQLLAYSDAFIVTNDSINMISEVCSTQKPVLILNGIAKAKHEKFVKSLGQRVSRTTFEFDKNHEALNELERVAQLVLSEF